MALSDFITQNANTASNTMGQAAAQLQQYAAPVQQQMSQPQPTLQGLAQMSVSQPAGVPQQQVEDPTQPGYGEFFNFLKGLQSAGVKPARQAVQQAVHLPPVEFGDINVYQPMTQEVAAATGPNMAFVPAPQMPDFYGRANQNLGMGAVPGSMAGGGYGAPNYTDKALYLSTDAAAKAEYFRQNGSAIQQQYYANMAKFWGGEAGKGIRTANAPLGSAPGIGADAHDFYGMISRNQAQGIPTGGYGQSAGFANWAQQASGGVPRNSYQMSGSGSGFDYGYDDGGGYVPPPAQYGPMAPNATPYGGPSGPQSQLGPYATYDAYGTIARLNSGYGDGGGGYPMDLNDADWSTDWVLDWADQADAQVQPLMGQAGVWTGPGF